MKNIPVVRLTEEEETDKELFWKLWNEGFLSTNQRSCGTDCPGSFGKIPHRISPDTGTGFLDHGRADRILKSPYPLILVIENDIARYWEMR